jgi:hypothetical protein
MAIKASVFWVLILKRTYGFGYYIYIDFGYLFSRKVLNPWLWFNLFFPIHGGSTIQGFKVVEMNAVLYIVGIRGYDFKSSRLIQIDMDSII